MNKIPTLFKRDFDNNPRLVTREINEGCEWVVQGEGVATRKMDGTCCLVRDGKFYKRYTLRNGKQPPENFEPATDPDPNTGKVEGWVPVGDSPDDRWHREAWSQYKDTPLSDGTYELCGPKIQGNPEGFTTHVLSRHGEYREADVPRDFDSIREYLEATNIEGIVWHHPDGRMVKIKKRDFGLKR